LGTLEKPPEKRARQKKVREILVEKLCLKVEAEGVYSFLHQNFRDYFAALHILHETEMGLKRGKVAEVSKERALPVYVRRFMGEIEGEHYQRPIFQEGKGWVRKEDDNSLLNRVLALCSGEVRRKYGVWAVECGGNLKRSPGRVEWCRPFRIGLIAGDIERRAVQQFFGDKYLAARFDRSLVHEMCLFPREDTNMINSAVYSGDGKQILFASWDNIIKEWDVESGQCVKTFNTFFRDIEIEENSCHTGKILKNGWNKIKIKSRETGKTLRTLINIPGLFFQGCSFENLHPDSDLSNECKDLPRMYGARI
jgi:hypothetical protein